jgi:hypothetical protein
MGIRRSVSLLLVLALLIGSVRSSYATVATGAATDRGVFTLTASGAAKLGLAESQIAAAVRVLGILGKVSTAVTVGFVTYEVTTGLWDWWNATYAPGASATVATPAAGTFGVQSGVGIYDCVKWERIVWAGGGTSTYDYTAYGCPPGAWTAIVGQTQTISVSGGGHVITSIMLHGTQTALPTAASGHAAPGQSSGRDVFLATLDAAKAELAGMSALDADLVAATASQAHPYAGSATSFLTGLIDAARSAVSSGIALSPDDYSATNPGASAGAMPGAIPGTGESTAPSTPSTDTGIAAAAAAISAAVAASASAIVSAVQAIPAAVAASASAIVSAVQAVAAPIVSAVAASQAAVVSAVQAIPAAISAALNPGLESIEDAVTALGPKIDAIAPGGGAAGVVEELQAEEEAAADAAAAAEAPEVSCPECERTDQWEDVWSAMREAGMAAPVFGLINRIVINPTGTIERVQTVSTASFGTVTFNLNQWGIDTYIGVVRYVVIFAALMAAYFVIFG